MVIASKFVGVTSMTSEASSATARVTRARVVRDRRREGNFMTGGREEWDKLTVFVSDLYGVGHFRPTETWHVVRGRVPINR